MAQVTSGRVSGAFSQCLGWPAMDKISASAVLSHLTPDLGYIARQSPTSWQQHFYPARFGRVTRGGGGRDRQRPPNHESQANVSALSPVHLKLLRGPKLELGHSNDPDLAPVGSSEKTPAFPNWVHYPGS
ncbi:hypothetical protein E4U57_005683 [Claviceps arundinis]|uniref:Uncharacterized protein n=1 Tax=Claviceps arundinis TaxID=1623583 RepID=A0ABQ7P2Y5_9HYPO|nr:hypothetical protein E4U57_005683 [Claviceps arundinis]